MDDCGGCALFINRGPNMVPCGEGWVNEGDSWECSGGHDPGDCPFVPAEPHYAVRSYSHGFDEEQWDAADYERERGRA